MMMTPSCSSFGLACLLQGVVAEANRAQLDPANAREISEMKISEVEEFKTVSFQFDRTEFSFAFSLVSL